MFRGAIRGTRGGSLLDVSIVPGAPSTRMRGYDAWRRRAEIRVAARPTRGEANEALLEFLSGLARVPRSRLSIVVGVTSRWKTIRLDGVAPDALARALEAGRSA